MHWWSLRITWMYDGFIKVQALSTFLSGNAVRLVHLLSYFPDKSRRRLNSACLQRHFARFLRGSLSKGIGKSVGLLICPIYKIIADWTLRDPRNGSRYYYSDKLKHLLWTDTSSIVALALGALDSFNLCTNWKWTKLQLEKVISRIIIKRPRRTLLLCALSATWFFL